mmetsp:Transcript_23815/g.67444  ORF Transcript_23815/g.67444 Transcript_23815/m.67444 type:complete len:302 (-) Transcript_23815:112-1017(-)
MQRLAAMLLLLLLATAPAAGAVVRLNTRAEAEAHDLRAAVNMDSASLPPAADQAYFPDMAAIHSMVPLSLLKVVPFVGGGHQAWASLLSFSKAHSELNPDSEPHIVIGGGSQVIQPSKEELAQENLSRNIVALISIMVWAAFAALVAQYYLDSWKVKPAPSEGSAVEEAMSTFKYGVFECFGEPKICCWVLCCPAIRWADNISTMGVLRSFWLAFVMYLGVTLIFNESVDLCAWLLVALIGAGFRQELRLKFKMPTGKMIFFQDLFLYCCCTCCAITQEARQVEEAAKLGHPAVVQLDDSV